MEWFVYFDAGQLHLHRSSTGAWIYSLKLDDCPTVVRVVETWVNCYAEHYRETDLNCDRQLLDFLLRGLLLGNDVPSPIRAIDNDCGQSGLFLHRIIGQNHPVRIVADGDTIHDAVALQSG